MAQIQMSNMILWPVRFQVVAEALVIIQDMPKVAALEEHIFAFIIEVV